MPPDNTRRDDILTCAQKQTITQPAQLHGRVDAVFFVSTTGCVRISTGDQETGLHCVSRLPRTERRSIKVPLLNEDTVYSDCAMMTMITSET